MKSQELLNNIYDESKAMNRNMQRLCNIGLIGVILNISREAVANDDEELRGLCRVALGIAGVAQLVIAVAEVVECWKRKKIVESD